MLLRLWRQALARDEGLDLGTEGVTSTMVYWADVMYAAPKLEMAEHESNDSVIERDDQDVDMRWQSGLSGGEQSWGAGREGPHIVVSHSRGTVIAYDCLKRVPDCPQGDGLMTIGSPRVGG